MEEQTKKMKSINKKQGIGLFFAGVAVLVAVIANQMPESYGWIMTGMAVLLFITGVFLVFKYRK